MAERQLSVRQLNRATLARQHLLERVRMPACDLIAHLVGLQAQEQRDPYVGLWSRLVDFDPSELETLLLDRAVVRMVVQRGTVHAITAEDARVLRPLAQPILTQGLANHSDYGPPLADVDLKPVLKYAAAVLKEPHTTPQLRAALAAEFPDHDAAALAFACRNLLPFVQVPPRGLWSKGGQVVGTTLKAWTGHNVERKPSVDDVIVRYLRAFGPASVQDAATWSRYTALREVFERLRPQLVTYRDDNGREYFDVPDTPLPDADMPAPVRILPQYDNLLLSHKDRSRFIVPQSEALGAIWLEHRGFVGSFLVDGMLTGPWKIEDTKATKTTPRGLTMTFTTSKRLKPVDKNAITAEAERFLRFVDADANQRIKFQQG